MNKLFIICGHGGNPYDPGAIGNGYKEAEQVRKLGKRIKELGGDKVVLGDISQNWYATGGITTYPFEKGTEILELHMDANDKPDPKGGHIIIDADFMPDDYDKKLAEMISTMFPGRAQNLYRRNLANTNRAQAKGVSYRLIECGFITNPDDAAKFEKEYDTLARKILDIFGIKPVDKAATVGTGLKEETVDSYTIELSFNSDGNGGTFKVLK